MAYPIVPQTNDPAQWINGRVLTLASTFAGTVGSPANTSTNTLVSILVPTVINQGFYTFGYNGAGLRFKAWGITINNADTKTIGFTFGASTSYTQALTASTANPWEAELLVIRTGVATQDSFFKVTHGTAVLALQQATTGTDNLVPPVTSPTNLTAAITVTLGTGTLNDVQINGVFLELLG